MIHKCTVLQNIANGFNTRNRQFDPISSLSYLMSTLLLWKKSEIYFPLIFQFLSDKVKEKFLLH